MADTRAAAIRKEHARCADGSARAEALLGGDAYPCTGSHDDGFHHFAADLPDPCPAPYCKLPAGHRTLHDIPAGKPQYRIREARTAVSAALAGEEQPRG